MYIDGIIGRNEPRLPISNHLTITLFSKLLEEGELFSLNHGSWTETGELWLALSVDFLLVCVCSTNKPLLSISVFLSVEFRGLSLTLDEEEQGEKSNEIAQFVSSEEAHLLSSICSSSAATSIIEGLMSL